MVPVALRKRFHGLSVLDCPIFSGPQESCYIFHGKNKLSPHTALVSHLYHEAQGSSPGADPHRGGMPSQPGQQLVSTSLNLFPLGLCTRPWGSRTANGKVSILVVALILKDGFLGAVELWGTLKARETIYECGREKRVFQGSETTDPKPPCSRWNGWK